MNGRSEALNADSESLTYELHASSFSPSNYCCAPDKSWAGISLSYSETIFEKCPSLPA